LNKRPTRSDVARLAKVSVATVSYVVNNGPRPVAGETKQRVQDAIKELDYKPHAIARSLKTGQTQTIGVLVPNVVAGYFGHLVTEIELRLAERGYSMLLANSQEDHEREKRMLALLSERSIDGLLHVPISHKNAGIIEELINDGIPVVFMDRDTPNVHADRVMTDNINAARQVTSYLIQKQCKRILCLTFHDEASSAFERVAGYRQALEEHCMPVDENLIMFTKWPFGDSVETMLEQHFSLYGIPDGIFCTVEGFLAGTIRVARKFARESDTHIQVAGGFTASFSPWTELLENPIPILRQKTETIAKQAVNDLMLRLQGDKSPPHITLVEAEFHI
jgi:LacI family transcriptional regulator